MGGNKIARVAIIDIDSEQSDRQDQEKEKTSGRTNR